MASGSVTKLWPRFVWEVHGTQHVPLFTRCLWLLSRYNGRVQSLSLILQSLECLLSAPLPKNSSPWVRLSTCRPFFGFLKTAIFAFECTHPNVTFLGPLEMLLLNLRSRPPWLERAWALEPASLSATCRPCGLRPGGLEWVVCPCPPGECEARTRCYTYRLPDMRWLSVV